MTTEQYSDDQILAGLERHLAGVERLVPRPPKWQASGRPDEAGLSASPRVSMRGRYALGALAPLVLVAAVAVVAVGVGLGGRGGSPGTPTPAVPDTLTFSYGLVPPAGVQVTDADLNATIQIVSSRLRESGSHVLASKTKPPDGFQITVSESADVPDTAELERIRALVSPAGEFELILLPRDQYGYVDVSAGVVVAGARAVPSKGEAIDPALKAAFTGADLDRSQVAAGSNQLGGWQLEFAFNEQKAVEFEAWSGQHIGEYIALVIDGRAFSAPYIRAAIAGGHGAISGFSSLEEAEQIGIVLRFGPLPMPIQELEFWRGETFE